MAARGGRGGGRGGGGGRGTNNMPVGHLLYADIIAQTKEMKDELYPKVETVQTDYPTEREAAISKIYNQSMQDLKLTPFYVDGTPAESTAALERWTDRFKQRGAGSTGAGGTYPTLAALHAERQWDKALHPAASFEALLEKKKRRRIGEGRAKEARKVRLDDFAKEDGAAGEGEREGEDSEAEEDPDLLEDEEAEEDGNDYEMDYFDNGEDDDFEALGAGGGGGGGGDDDFF
ncbi:hypothetical protein OIO90_000304 [Microbotryomycetes sp. JL221]|nr:hypothetical protein OIO90_000304 [Microbotryomycetes sp. JL221]